MSEVAVPATVSVTPSPQLTVTWVTVVLLATVNVADTCCPTIAGLGDSAGVDTTGTFPLVTVIGKAVLAPVA